MPSDLSIVSPPVTGLYRLAYAFPGPFELRSWENADPDGTFGNRFDDPALHLPTDERFQVFYCATQRHVTFAETLASLFPSLATLAGMASIQDDESVESVQIGAADPDDPHYGLVRADWRLPRVMGHTILQPKLQFVDLGTAQTSQYLRQPLAAQALAHGATDIDLSLLMDSRRGFTNIVARYIYELCNEDGTPRFAGIRYISRLDTSWECWAVFADRIEHISGMPSLPELIYPDDPDLLEIASIFQLAIETVAGSGHYYRP